MTFPKINELRNIVQDWAPADYFADEAINFHSLRDYKRNPKRYANGEYETSETTDAMRIGTQFHQLVLEGEDVFNSHNALWTPPVNEKTGKPYGAETKAYAAALETWKAENAGKTFYSADELKLFNAMKEAIISNPVAGGYLYPAGDVSEYASELRFKGEYIPGWFAKGSIDRYDPEVGIIDLKTCSEIEGALNGKQSFELACKFGPAGWGYIEQMAFYQIMFFELIDPRPREQRDYIPVTIIGVEKKPPFEVEVCQPDEETQAAARETIKKTLDKYAYSITNQIFPSKYDEIVTIHKYYKDFQTA